MVRSFLTPVRGHAFAGRPPGAPEVAGGRPARLVREPDNPVDALAVAVWLTAGDGPAWRIGYLDRLVAARLAPRLDRGDRYRVALEGWWTEPEGRWRRPALRVTRDAPVAKAPPGGVWARPPGVRRRQLTPGG